MLSIFWVLASVKICNKSGSPVTLLKSLKTFNFGVACHINTVLSLWPRLLISRRRTWPFRCGFSPRPDQAQHTTQLALPLGKGQSLSWRHSSGWGRGMRRPPVPKQGCRKVYSSQVPGLVPLRGDNVWAWHVISRFLCWPGWDGKAHVSLRSQSEPGLLSTL